jgi:hypothetical protein
MLRSNACHMLNPSNVSAGRGRAWLPVGPFRHFTVLDIVCVGDDVLAIDWDAVRQTQNKKKEKNMIRSGRSIMILTRSGKYAQMPRTRLED